MNTITPLIGSDLSSIKKKFYISPEDRLRNLPEITPLRISNIALDFLKTNNISPSTYRPDRDSSGDFHFDDFLSLDKSIVKAAKAQIENFKIIRDSVKTQWNQLYDSQRDDPDASKQLDILNEVMSHLDLVVQRTALINNFFDGIGIVYRQNHYPPQRGHLCKLEALALIDAKYAHDNSIKAVPLISGKKEKTSLRKIAKSFGSVQGEVLQLEDLIRIINLLGYQVEVKTPKDKHEFSKIIDENIENEAIITFYSVDVEQPDRIDITPNPMQWREHASVISKYNKGKQTVTLNHHGEAYPDIAVERLRQSSKQLVETRNTEYYFNDRSKKSVLQYQPKLSNNGHDYKYMPVDKKDVDFLESLHHIKVVRSKTPKPDSGFNSKLLLIKPNYNHPRWQIV